jgi:hypothetical protein
MMLDLETPGMMLDLRTPGMMLDLAALVLLYKICGG